MAALSSLMSVQQQQSEDASGSGNVSNNKDSAASTSNGGVAPVVGPSPMEMLVEDMKSDLIETRINGIKNLASIAKALGPIKTINELIPFLVERINDEDEVFFEIALQINVLIDCIDEQKNLVEMMPLFDLLLSIEEKCVREKTIDAIKEISQKLDKSIVAECFFNLVNSLAESPWFTKKICACRLIAFIHKYVSYENQLFLIDKFMSLTREDMPLIRKTAVMHLFELTQNLFEMKPQLNDELENSFRYYEHMIMSKNSFMVFSKVFPSIKKLTEDEQDMVRVLLLPELSKIIELIIGDFNEQGQKELLLPLIMPMLNDQSWKVRSMCAAELTHFQRMIEPSIFTDIAIEKFINYLNDADNEVVVRSTLCISQFVDALPESRRYDFIVNKLSPRIDQFINSGNIHIKTSLSESIVKLTKYLSKSQVAEHLLSFYMSLLRDQNSDINLTTISQVCQSNNESLSIIELSSTIFDSLSELIRDPNWRVRAKVTKLLPNIFKTIGFESDESNDLIKTCLQMLNDSVYAVRESVIETICCLVQIKGYQWAQTKLMPSISELHTSQNYLIRQVCISCISSFANLLTTEELIELYELVKPLVDDQVPSVKIRLIKFYQESIYHRMVEDKSEQAAEICKEIKTNIEKFTKNIDPDVSDCANVFLETIVSA